MSQACLKMDSPRRRCHARASSCAGGRLQRERERYQQSARDKTTRNNKQQPHTSRESDKLNRNKRRRSCGEVVRQHHPSRSARLKSGTVGKVLNRHGQTTPQGAICSFIPLNLKPFLINLIKCFSLPAFSSFSAKAMMKIS